ncbi:hypothetical protein GVN24_33470 [Rhizobium sp. CRIBSB]|nr:hypothetical protein [Rhizobium sp. CRIBSB]
MFGRFAFMLALLAAPMAWAQEADEDVPATAAEIAEARATADQLIRDAEADGIFTNKTNDSVPTVEHAASGMRCLFSGSASDRIMVFPNQDDDIPRGDDVGCTSREEALAVETTTYATRYRPMPSEDAVLDDSVRAIRNRWPDAIPFEGSLASTRIGELGAPKFAAFKVTTPDGPMLTMVLVLHVGEWGYKVRATGRYEDAMLVSVFAGVVMANIQIQALDD